MSKPVLQFAFDPKIKDPVEKNKPESTEEEAEPTPDIPFELVEIKEGLYELRGAPDHLRDGILPAVKVVKLGERKKKPLQGVEGRFTKQ